MSLNLYKIATQELCNSKGWSENTILETWLLFTEEVGELATCIRKHKNLYHNPKQFHKTEEELGDVFSYLFQIASMLDIDLDKVWSNHYKKSLRKRYSKPNNFLQNHTHETYSR